MDKKIEKDESLAKIKVLISKFYGSLGRDMIEDVDIEQKQLIEDIDTILNNTNISAKNLIIEQLSLDNKIKGKIKETIEEWKQDI